MKFFLFAVMTVASVARAADTRLPLLYDIHRNRYVQWKEKVRPERVYAIYSERLRRWSNTLSDEEGKFPEPNEFFLTGSVVRGSRLGADTNKFYEFQSGDKWVPTKATAEKHIFWVNDKKPFYRIVTFDTRS